MQGNLQDDLHLRRNLLRAVCAPLSWKVVLIFSEVQKYNWHMDLINNHIFGLMLLSLTFHGGSIVLDLTKQNRLNCFTPLCRLSGSEISPFYVIFCQLVVKSCCILFPPDFCEIENHKI